MDCKMPGCFNRYTKVNAYNRKFSKEDILNIKKIKEFFPFSYAIINGSSGDKGIVESNRNYIQVFLNNKLFRDLRPLEYFVIDEILSEI